LMKDLDDKGKKGETVEVKPGYFKNWLFPNGLAALPSDETAKKILTAVKIEQDKKKNQLNNLKKIASELEEKTLTFILKEGKNGQIFGSVSAADIAAKLNIDKHIILLEHTLKEKGQCKVTVRFSPQISSQINIKIKGVKTGNKLDK